MKVIKNLIVLIALMTAIISTSCRKVEDNETPSISSDSSIIECIIFCTTPTLDTFGVRIDRFQTNVLDTSNLIDIDTICFTMTINTIKLYDKKRGGISVSPTSYSPTHKIKVIIKENGVIKKSIEIDGSDVTIVRYPYIFII